MAARQNGSKWAIVVHHLDGSQSVFGAATLALAKRDGNRYLAHPAAASVDCGPWEGPAEGLSYHRERNDPDWHSLGHRGRILPAVRVKVNL